MGCINYCSEGFGEHTQNNCDEVVLGGSSAVIIGQCGTEVTDPSDEAEIQALLDAGTATLIAGVRVDLPAGSPVTIDSPVGCGTTKRINEDRTLNMFDSNVNNANSAFYDTLNSSQVAWILVYLCDSDKVLFINPAGAIQASVQLIVPPQNNDIQRFESVFSWRDKAMPLSYDAPAGIFS